jgi:hypothetical protein
MVFLWFCLNGPTRFWSASGGADRTAARGRCKGAPPQPYTSDQGSRQNQSRGGPKVQPQHTSGKAAQNKGTTDEVMSPANSKFSRQRKPRGAGKTAPAKATELVLRNDQRISGHKRKEYRPKIRVPPTADDSPPPEMPARALALVPTVATVTGDGGDDQETDSDILANKKHKKDVPETSSRSVDLAEAAVQPRRTQ